MGTDVYQQFDLGRAADRGRIVSEEIFNQASLIRVMTLHKERWQSTIAKRDLQPLELELPATRVQTTAAALLASTCKYNQGMKGMEYATMRGRIYMIESPKGESLFLATSIFQDHVGNHTRKQSPLYLGNDLDAALDALNEWIAKKILTPEQNIKYWPDERFGPEVLTSDVVLVRAQRLMARWQKYSDSA